jgi:hypothetical protein
MAITPETLRIINEAKQGLQRITDEHTNQLVGAWVAAWDDLRPEFEASLVDLMIDAKDGYVSRAAAAKHRRLAATLELAKDRIVELSDGIEPIVSADLSEVTAQAYASQAAAIGSQLPPAMATVRVTLDHSAADALDHIVKRSLEQIHKDSRPLADDVVRVMKRELIRGIAVGDNPRRTAARIVKQTESRFNGGLTRAMVIARNEVLDSHRAATKVTDEQSAEVMAGWRWGAPLSARTCPSCLANHGTVHPISEDGPIDHHQGRCARIPLTKSWAELGFPGLKEPADALPDAREWFDNLTPETQLQIMGKERLALLQDGKIQWSDMTTRTTNGQWRDSMTVTPLKDLRAAAALAG